MDEDGRTLSQDEIDAMLKSTTPRQSAPPPTSPAPAPQAAPVSAAPEPAPQAAPVSAAPEPAPQAAPVSAAPEPAPQAAPVSTAPEPAPRTTSGPGLAVDSSLSAIVAELAQRLSVMEATLGRFGQIEKALAETKSGGSPNLQDFQAVVKQLKKVTAQVNNTAQGLQGTPGYGAQTSFKCSSCGAQGLVATPFRCTRCGKDRWLGWWPKK
jgi:hypothetical protein